MDKKAVHFRSLCQIRTRRLMLVMGMIASIFLVFQTVTFLSKSYWIPLLVSGKPPILKLPGKDISAVSIKVGKVSLLSDASNSTDLTIVFRNEESAKESGKDNYDVGDKEMNGYFERDDSPESDDDVDLVEDQNPEEELSLDIGDGARLKKSRDPVDGLVKPESIALDPSKAASLGKAGELDIGVGEGVNRPDSVLAPQELKASDKISVSKSDASPLTKVGELDIRVGEVVSKPDFSAAEEIKVPDEIFVSASDTSSPTALNTNVNLQLTLEKNLANPPIRMGSHISSGGQTVDTIFSSGHQSEGLPKNETLVPLLHGPVILQNISANATATFVKKKRKVHIYIQEMNQLLLKNRASYRSMGPRWPSARDKQILAMKAQIEAAPIVHTDQELYAPAFRNISIFKRSYELMERTLKIYIYKEGEKPIFHQPLLHGIYASEGWFMKLMERNKRFLVRDPRRAHMFYMPFSSRFLQSVLYVPNSKDRTKLVQHLKDYLDKIARKYPFWNRTEGADHFLAACHDWAPYETRLTMEHAIRALCNADIRRGFQMGKDVSLPETNIRSAQNPLRDLGGRPPNQRPTLAFFAGNMHGSLRPILLKHWENKDPEMKIFGPMPRDADSKMAYIQHMKTSKYCICPRGHEVNSPRVVESIFYECVPVLISDNYVLPFFEVLNWEAFSVSIREKDIPRLKEILLSIPKEKYLALQMGVRKVQKHFLWHSRPVKYDLFYMILHSIWLNRVYTI